MDTYNPSKNIDATIWLALDEVERLVMIEEYVINYEKEIDDEASGLHASAHLVVENQLALEEKETVETFARLRRQGLSRHETIHAIGAVIFESINEGLIEKDKDLTIRYKSRFRKLTAKKWLKGEY